MATPGSISVTFLGQGGRSPDRSRPTWGEEFFAYGRSSDRRDSRARYRYIGVERDEETGLCMTGPRTYDPVSGRFLQGDPVVGGAPYVYSRGNPITRMDGNGYQDTPPVGFGDVKLAESLNPTNAADLLNTDVAASPASQDFSRALEAGVGQSAEIPSPDLLMERTAQLRSLTARTGQEAGGLYYTTSSGREGFIYAGLGTSSTMGKSIENAASLLPKDALTVVTMHSHPAEWEGSGFPSVADVNNWLGHSNYDAAVVAGATAGPFDSTGSKGSGSTLLAYTAGRENASSSLPEGSHQ